MKITKIEIKNFRAFPKDYHIDLYNAGKNLLVYGENGSGKSSLYLALKYFFESDIDTIDDGEEIKSTGFEKNQNLFIQRSWLYQTSFPFSATPNARSL